MSYSDEYAAYYGSSEDDYGNEISDDDTRIVNGYDAGKRPWLVMIHVEGGACGGALINKKYNLKNLRKVTFLRVLFQIRTFGCPLFLQG